MFCKDGTKECTGCMACQSDPEPLICPFCSKEADYFYYDIDGDLFACDRCVVKKNVWEVGADA